MDNDSTLGTGVTSHGILVLPSLVLSRCVTALPPLVLGLLLIDIGETFGVHVGLTGQMRTASSFIGILFALITGALSVRIGSKTLLMMGLLIYSLSALGCYLSPNFNIMLVLFSLIGFGFALVTPMVTTLVGKHIPLEKRAGAIGWTIAGMSLLYVFGTTLTNMIASRLGWRWAFLGFVLPLSVSSLLMVSLNIPSESPKKESGTRRGSYLEGFREILENTSAVACLIGTAMAIAAWNVMLIYGASFWRQRFSVSRGFVSTVIIVMALCYTSGSLITGRFVNRFGRKPLTVISVFMLGLLTIFSMNVPNLWLSIFLGFFNSFFGGMSIAAFSSLTLEHVPTFRGTMMSLSASVTSLGQVIGAGVGGMLLIMFSYGVLGIVLGAIGIVGATIFNFLTIDPTTL